MSWLGRLLGRPRRPAGPDAAALREGGFVALDIETTGLDPRRDAVVSLAAIPFVAGRPRPGCAALVNPGRAIPPASTAIHGITDAAVRDAPPIGAVLPALVARCDGAVLVGHDVGFDLAVLGRELRAHGRGPLVGPALDTRRLAAGLYPGWRDVGLDALAAQLGIAIAGRHTAEGDARAAGDILLALLPELVARGFRTVDEMLWLQQSAVWSRLVY
jgi:DNA polymerase III epsilon subunit-like protein